MSLVTAFVNALTEWVRDPLMPAEPGVAERMKEKGFHYEHIPAPHLVGFTRPTLIITNPDGQQCSSHHPECPAYATYRRELAKTYREMGIQPR